MDEPLRIRRLRWMCRRGMQELDLLLQSFLERHEAELGDGAWPQLEAFLAEEDDRIWSWIQSAGTPGAPGYRELVDALRRRG